MIVHLGAGNFHRSHQAAYLDELGDPAWTICAVGTRPSDAALRDAMRANDCAFVLRLLHGDGRVEARTIRSIREYLLLPEEPGAVRARLVDPNTRVVSLTVTEGGYVANDSLFGVLVEALLTRRARGLDPFTVVSCDNITHNGAVARAAVLRACANDSARAWITDCVAFPSTMVDRITPATPPGDTTVSAEPFTQWVLEDDFPAGRPALERVGVQLVADVAPYEAMKLRLLNGAHQAIAFTGLLRGHTFVHAAMQDPEVVAVVRDYLAETVPAVPPVPGIDLDRYCATLVERFANPYIADTLERLAAFTDDRIPLFVLPAIRDNLRAGRSVAAGAYVCASAAVWLGRHYLPWLGELRAVPAFADAFDAAIARLRG